MLKARGLTITDDGRATAALEQIGYDRLSGYWYPLRTSTGAGATRKVEDTFRLGSEFGYIVDLYVFDKKLRLLTLDAIERVEVALRTDISLLLGQYSPVAHRDPAFLHGRFTKNLLRGKTVTGHQVWLDRLDDTTVRSREDQPPLPRKGEVLMLDHMMADPHLQKRYYAVAAVLRYINPTTTRPTRLTDLVATLPAAPGISIRHMGFPRNWTSLPSW